MKKFDKVGNIGRMPNFGHIGRMPTVILAMEEVKRIASETILELVDGDANELADVVRRVELSILKKMETWVPPETVAPVAATPDKLNTIAIATQIYNSNVGVPHKFDGAVIIDEDLVPLGELILIELELISLFDEGEEALFGLRKRKLFMAEISELYEYTIWRIG